MGSRNIAYTKFIINWLIRRDYKEDMIGVPRYVKTDGPILG
jgi:hypothetical protein